VIAQQRVNKALILSLRSEVHGDLVGHPTSAQKVCVHRFRSKIMESASRMTVWPVVHSVNGDLAIRWEWSNFDPSQNPNPLTDYYKICSIDYVHETNT